MKITKKNELVISRKDIPALRMKRYERDCRSDNPNAIRECPWFTPEIEEMQAEIGRWCESVNGKAKVRKVGMGGVESFASSIFSMVDAQKIPASIMEGCRMSCDINGQKFPAAYKFIPESTRLYAVWSKGKLVITAKRERCLKSASTFFDGGVPEKVLMHLEHSFVF